jgi:hypothetical protein
MLLRLRRGGRPPALAVRQVDRSSSLAGSLSYICPTIVTVMARWVRRWEVTIRWDRVSDSPRGTTKWVTHADTPRQLRTLIETARTDPLITGYKYRSIRMLDGDEPTTCRNGHGYAGGSATRPRLGWLDCPACPGHTTYTCIRNDCGDIRLDPEPAYDCKPRPPRRHPPAR